jgi:hypothetical protein
VSVRSATGSNLRAFSGQDDAKHAAVVGVALAAHQLLALEQAHHRRHRLLAQPRPARKFPHTQPILLEQRHQDRAVAGPSTRFRKPLFYALRL